MDRLLEKEIIINKVSQKISLITLSNHFLSLGSCNKCKKAIKDNYYLVSSLSYKKGLDYKRFHIECIPEEYIVMYVMEQLQT